MINTDLKTDKKEFFKHIIPQEEFIKFCTAGNSVFTLVSLKTQTRYTYKVLASDDRTAFYVKCLAGPNNNEDYYDLARIRLRDGVPDIYFISGKGRMFVATSKAYLAIEHVFMNCLVKIKMLDVEIWHEGRCCRCGRRLTVPESIEQGYGPECVQFKSLKPFTVS